MNKTTEALKLAEEAMTSNMRLLGAKALAAIREALAEQDKQERVVWAILAPPAPPEVYQMRSRDAYEAGWLEAQRQKAVSPIAPVFAKREWVDLTDDEIWEAVKNWNLKERVEGNYSLTREIIAKFKEKNK